jgi:hypothetical protein
MPFDVVVVAASHSRGFYKGGRSKPRRRAGRAGHQHAIPRRKTCRLGKQQQQQFFISFFAFVVFQYKTGIKLV